MQVLSSLKTAKTRHRDCQIVRRKGRVYVICKSNPRFKARQTLCQSRNVLLNIPPERKRPSETVFQTAFVSFRRFRATIAAVRHTWKTT